MCPVRTRRKIPLSGLYQDRGTEMLYVFPLKISEVCCTITPKPSLPLTKHKSLCIRSDMKSIPSLISHFFNVSLPLSKLINHQYYCVQYKVEVLIRIESVIYQTWTCRHYTMSHYTMLVVTSKDSKITCHKGNIKVAKPQST